MKLKTLSLINAVGFTALVVWRVWEIVPQFTRRYGSGAWPLFEWFLNNGAPWLLLAVFFFVLSRKLAV